MNDLTVSNTPDVSSSDITISADSPISIINVPTQGPPGLPGEAGERGPQGFQGPTGAVGPVGSTGAAGTDGKTVLNGTTVPSAGVGSNGDFYIRTTTNEIYGPKSSGAWGTPTPMTGPTGPQGPTGSTGPQGPTGPAGASAYGGMAFTWSSSNTTSVDPGVGNVRFNAGTLTIVTQIAIDDQSADAGNPDVSNYLLQFDDSTNTQKGYLIITQPSAPGTFLVFAITGLNDQSGYVQINGTRAASAGAFINGNTINIEFARSGDVGAQGPTGPAGAGSPGTSVPIMDGTGTVGTSSLFSREDHIHPTDTSRAPLNSPGLTGTPTAPTASAATNNTQIATTAYVKSQAYAPLASPALTGNPTAPTPTAGDSDTSIATTAFVTGAVGSAISPLAPLASPALTGNPTAPTATAGDNDTSIANTAFVQAAIASGLAAVQAQGRLSFISGSPVMTAPLIGGTVIYYVPHRGNFVPLWNGTAVVVANIGGQLTQTTTDTTKSPAACVANKNYDVFVWNDSGTIRATRGPAWSSDTSRGTGAGTTELTRTGPGFLVNANAITNGPAASRGTYVGTIRTNSGGTLDFRTGGSASGGSPVIVGLWNAYNRVMGGFTSNDNAAAWGVQPLRNMNGSANNRLSYVMGLDEDVLQLSMWGRGAASNTHNCQAFFGLDGSTSGFGPINLFYGSAGNIDLVASFTMCSLGGNPGIGWHFFQALENTDLASSCTLYGTTNNQIGLMMPY